MDASDIAAADTVPAITTMPRAVHELVTGKKPDEMIAAGTLITADLAKQHKLDGNALEALAASGAIEAVEVVKG